MEILLTGGTGFIGSELLKHLSNDHIVLLTRNIEKAKTKFLAAGITNISYINSLDGYTNFNAIDAVINLAGEPIVGKRWSKKQKEKICNSRWTITAKLAELISLSTAPPEVFISGSAVGYYGNQSNQLIDESFSPINKGFPHSICSTWESIAQKAKSDKTRVCTLRTGVVLGKDGGVLPMMLLPFKFALGSSLGDGKQYMPWIHIKDMISAVIFLLETPAAKGCFNLCSPYPVTNKEFSKKLAYTLNRPLSFKIPQWFFNITMGKSSCILFDSIRARPKNLLRLGFNFSQPRLESALSELLY